jgi:hypothetical protein
VEYRAGELAEDRIIPAYLNTPPTLTVTASVTVISLIGAVPVISAVFGGRAPVLSLVRPTVSAANLILAALSVVGAERVIEIANDVVEALNRAELEAGCAAGTELSSRIAPTAQSSPERIENLAHLLILMKLTGNEYHPAVRLIYVGAAREKRQARKLLRRTLSATIRAAFSEGSSATLAGSGRGR